MKFLQMLIKKFQFKNCKMTFQENNRPNARHIRLSPSICKLLKRNRKHLEQSLLDSDMAAIRLYSGQSVELVKSLQETKENEINYFKITYQ